MNQDHAPKPFPVSLIAGAGALVMISIIGALIGRTQGESEAPPSVSNVTLTTELRFGDRDDGSVVVFRGRSDEVIEVLEPGSGGFVRGVLRGLARERRQRGIGPQEPFRLSALSGGGLRLEDPATGRSIALEAFGPDNFGAFQALLNAATTPDKLAGGG